MGAASGPPEEAGKPVEHVVLPAAGSWEAGPPSETRTADPLPLDFDAPEPRPDWVVEGLFSRGELVMLSGAPGVGKSFMTLALVATIATATPQWLGRNVYADHAALIDEENPKPVLRRRLAAQGVTNNHRGRFTIYSRNGVRVGAPEWSGFFEAMLETLSPAVLVIDTAGTVLDVEDVSDNGQVARIMQYLRLCAERFDVAIVVLAHHRKSGGGADGGAMLGGVQWQGQADAHLQVTAPKTGQREEEDDGQGGTLQRTRATLSVAKLRDGFPTPDESVVIESYREDGSLVSLEVRTEGPIRTKVAETDDLLPRILAAVPAHPGITRGDLVTLLGVPDGRAFDDALKTLLVDKRITQAKKRAPYCLATQEPAI